MTTLSTGVVGALIALMLASAHAAEEPLPVERFAQGDAMSAPAMSPEGKRVVYIDHRKGAASVVILDLATKAAKIVLPEGTRGDYVARWCAFKNEERIVCGFNGVAFQQGQPYGTTRLLSFNSDGSKVRLLVQDRTGSRSQLQDRILHWLPDDPRNVLIQLDHNGNIYPDVFTLDVYSGRMQTVQRERRPVLKWMTDVSGTVRFGSGYESRGGSALYMARATAAAPWTVLEKFNLYDVDAVTPLGLGAQGDSVFMSAPNEGHAGAWEMDLAGSREPQLVFASQQADVERAITWPWDGRVLGFHYETDRPHAFYIDEVAKDAEAIARKELPDRFSEILGGSRDGKRLLIGAYSDVTPEAFYVLDLGAQRLEEIGSRNPDLDAMSLAPMKTILVPLEHHRIPGFLTVPVGREPKNLPLVVYPHGGPYARDRWGYDPTVQMLASRGYAVLQLNFRGSTGWGAAWFNAGWRGWGGAIHEDITSGTRWAIEQGIADPKRVCIVGWSYGGFAALLGVEREPDLYRCAVSIGGPSDLNALSDEASRYYGGSMSTRQSIGADKRALESDSPLKHVDRIKVPVMLIHGDADSTVLASHSEAMARALRARNVPTDLLIISGGGHNLENEYMRGTLYRKLESFLGANLHLQPRSQPPGD